MEKLRSAVIGCGRMGAFPSQITKKYGPKCLLPLSHIEALKEFNNISIQGICDTNSSLLKNAADKYKVENTYKNYDELLSNQQIDILCVATRTKERYKIIQAGIENGVKAFHIEKPLCNSMKQLKELELLISDNKVCLSYGTFRRYLHIYQKAKDLADSGKFGKLLQIQVNFGESGLFWTHPHSVDMVLFFSGERVLKAVQSHLSNVEMKSKDTIESDPIIEQSMMYFNDGLVGNIGKIPGMDVVLGLERGVIAIESNGGRIVIKEEFDNAPYFEYSKDTITDTYKKPQGTYSAISSLINDLNNKHYHNNQSIFIGQKVLFGFVDSHMNNGILVDMENISDKLVILGKSGSFYA